VEAVALKPLHPPVDQDPELLGPLATSASTAARSSHPAAVNASSAGSISPADGVRPRSQTLSLPTARLRSHRMTPS